MTPPAGHHRAAASPPGEATLTYHRDGAERHAGAVSPYLSHLIAILAHLPDGQAGVRVATLGGLRPYLASDGPIGRIAASVLGGGSRPVRAILFDKSAATNWSLGWHQDRTICVRERRNVAGYGPWTIKQGLPHVAPPVDLLAGMVTLRVHLDDVPASNGSLLIAPGSHTEGRIAVDRIDEVVRRRGIASCLAHAGDVWLYATLILHASNAAAVPGRRRVLQIDFSATELPGGLEWPAFQHDPANEATAVVPCDAAMSPIRAAVRSDHTYRRSGMAEANVIKEHMEVIGSDGGHVGTVDSIDSGRIKLTKSGSDDGRHHYVATALVQDIKGNTVTLTKPAAEATASDDADHPSDLPEDPQMGVAMDNG